MNQKVKFVYFGSPDFSTFVLDELEQAGFVPALVVTRPDEPAGRKHTLTPTPVKLWAEVRGIPVEESLNFENWKMKIGNFDLGILAAYGKIIPDPILNIFPKGILNIHPSLLPKFRGPTPVQSAILAGEKEMGVSVILLDKEMDHGPILKQVSGYSLQGVDYRKATEDLFRLGGQMLIKIIPDWIAGKIKSKEQNHTQATYTKKFTNGEAFIKPETITGHQVSEGTPGVQQMQEVEYAMRQVRALNPEPGTWTIVRSKNKELRIKILSAKIEDGKLVPVRVIPAGKKEMPFSVLLQSL